jgi:hypothetical protein
LQLDGTNCNESDSAAIGHKPIATRLLIATRREQIAIRMSPSCNWTKPSCNKGGCILYTECTQVHYSKTIYIYIYIYKVFVVRKKSTLGMLFYDSLPCCKQTRGTASQTLRTMRPRSWPSTPASPPRSSDHLIGADGDHHQRAGLAYQPADQASPHTLQEIRFQGSRKDSILTENMFIRA